MDLRTQFEKETGHNRVGIELAATETSAYIRWLESQYQSQSTRIRELEEVAEGMLFEVKRTIRPELREKAEKALNKTKNEANK